MRASICLQPEPVFSAGHQTPAGVELKRPAHDEPTAQLRQLLERGKSLRESGQTDQAIAVFNRAARLASQAHDSATEIAAIILISTAETRACRYRAAVSTLKKAQSMAETCHDAHMLGAICINLSNIYAQLGDRASANAEAERSVSYLRSIRNPTVREELLLANAYLSHAQLSVTEGRPTDGLKDFDLALTTAKSLPDRGPTQASIWDKKGVVLMEIGNLSEGESALKTALTLSDEAHDKDDRAFVEVNLAELEIRKHNPDFQLALKWIDGAFAEGSPFFNSSPQYYPIHVRARILLGLGKKPAALKEFNRAVDAANQWRMAALPGDTTNNHTVSQLETVYADYAHLAAQIALEERDNALAANALEILAQNRAAGLREQLRQIYSANFKIPDEYFLKLAQLQSAQAEVTLGQNAGADQAQLNRIRLELSDLENQIGLKAVKIENSHERIPRRNSLRDIQHTLGQDQVLLSISVGKDRSYLWAVTGDKINLYPLPGEGELTLEANSFKAAVRNGRADAPSGRDLSQALFGQLPPDVWNRSEWLMVADGALLNGIPFSALPTPNDGKPLITGHDLRFLPSELLLLEHPSVTGGGPDRTEAKNSFLGISDPIYNLADRRLPRTQAADAKSVSMNLTLARLVGSEREVESAAKVIGPSEVQVLSGAKATRSELEQALRSRPQIVHFAVHVVSPQDAPQQAALALSLKNGFPELLTPEVIASLHAPGSLVVLSGCSSGQGKILPGVGLVGISRAWLLAGADAVVVSDWPTPDDSGRFFSSFYRHFDGIRSGVTAERAALALRRTQLDMLHGSGYQASPTFWGAFAVISKE